MMKELIPKISFIFLLITMTFSLFYEPEQKLVVNVVDNIGCK